jgi:hypothetical protein
MNILKKWWPSIVHAAAVVATWLDPSVQAWVLNHKAQGAVILLVWGVFLHWLNSPKAERVNG